MIILVTVRVRVNNSLVTIAHRLKTIIEYDRILVLDQGQLAEEGTPLDLLERKGIFYEMVAKNGSRFEEEMRKLASNRVSS